MFYLLDVVAGVTIKWVFLTVQKLRVSMVALSAKFSLKRYVNYGLCISINHLNLYSYC